MSSKYFGKGRLKKSASDDESSDEGNSGRNSKGKDVGGPLDKWISKSPKKETDNQKPKPKADKLKEENEETVANFFKKRPIKSDSDSVSSASSGSESSESEATDPLTEEREEDRVSLGSENSGRRQPLKRQRKSSETGSNMKVEDRPKRRKEQTGASPKFGGKGTPKAKASPKSKVLDRPTPTGLAFDGLKFCVTGTFESTTRENVEENVKRYGGQVMSAVSSRTDYLVAGSVLEDGRAVEESGKFQKAEGVISSGKGKIKIITEDDFLKMLPQTEINTPMEDSPKSAKSPKMAKQKPAADSEPTTNTTTSSFAMWTDKWKPMTSADLIGNSDSVLKLKNWLRDWRSVVVEGKTKEVAKPSFRPGQRFQEPERINARGALLSGSPGIGKSSAARVVCKELGFSVIEMNASDDRGKSIIEVIRDMTSGGMNLRRGHVDENIVLVMDEVDGLAGGDRGGAQALGKLIDDSLIPVICICNDRMHPKVKTLASRCFDLRFSKPPKNIVAQRLAAKAAKEGLTVEPNAIESLCESNGNDIRLIVNNLQLKSKLTSRVTYDSVKSSKTPEKDIQVTMSPFDVAKRVLTSTDYKKSSFGDLLDYFFVDYDLMPLLMNENYLNTLSNNKALTSTAALSKAAEAADSFACGDVLNKSIRMDGNWGLLPEVAVFTLVVPGALASGFLVRPDFPRWLGKNSTQGKNRRLLAELSLYLGPSTTTSMSSFVKDGYLDLFYNRALSPLVNDDDVKGCMDFMDLYGVTKDQVVESMGQLKMSQDDLYASVNPKTKASFTKTYKASSHMIRMAPNLKKSQKQAAEATTDEGAADGSAPLKDTTPPAEDEDDVEEEMKNIDRLIKEKSKKNKATSKSSPKKKAKAKSPKNKAKAKAKSKAKD